MTLRVERGRGYRPRRFTPRFRKSRLARSARLQLDASSSPIRRVTYSVRCARVEQRTDLDKSRHRHRDERTIDAEEAIRRAGSILKIKAVVFVDLQGEEEAATRSQMQFDRSCSAGRRARSSRA